MSRPFLLWLVDVLTPTRTKVPKQLDIVKGENTNPVGESFHGVCEQVVDAERTAWTPRNVDQLEATTTALSCPYWTGPKIRLEGGINPQSLGNKSTLSVDPTFPISTVHGVP